MSRNNLSMFKAYDIRTKAEKLNASDIFDLVSAVSRYYKEDLKLDRVIIARDARLYCPGIMERFLEIMPSYGLDVLVNPLQISTCQFYYMCMHEMNAGGIMITASHNPGEYVGLKLVDAYVKPIASGCGINGGIFKIKEYYENPVSHKAAAKGKVSILQLEDEYVDYSMRLAGVKEGSLKGLRVFGEFLSGSSGTDFALAFTKAGAECTFSNLVPDGFFPSGDPNPIIEQSIAPSRRKMQEGGYDMGFCFDGDGDRMDLMYPDGSQIIPGLNISLLTPYIEDIFRPYFEKNQTFRSFVDVKAVPVSWIEIANSGIEPHIIRNGHSFIKEKLRENLDAGYLVAEEESAHYYMNFPFDLNDLSKGFAATENTLFFALLTARMLSEHPDEYIRIKKLQEGIIRYREWPLHFDVPDKMQEIMDEVEQVMKQRGASIIKEMDDGSDLDAVLMRFNLPLSFGKGDELPAVWAQVAQRISRSEDAMTRWEVVASSQKLCDELNNLIYSITEKYVKLGLAHY